MRGAKRGNNLHWHRWKKAGSCAAQGHEFTPRRWIREECVVWSVERDKDTMIGYGMVWYGMVWYYGRKKEEQKDVFPL